MACKNQTNVLVRDEYTTVVPKAKSTKSGDGYVAIAPKNVAMVSELQPLNTTPTSLSPKLPPYKVKSYTTRSMRVRAVSESMESHFKYRKSPKGLGKAIKNDKSPKHKSPESDDVGKIPLASARWDGYVHIAPKGTTTTKLQPLSTPPNSVSPTLPVENIKPSSYRSLPIQSSTECTESHKNLQKTPEAPKKPVMNEDTAKPTITTNDNLGAITPAFLARYHLPAILIKHGPLAIRHIMSFLTSVVPGFSRISPAKSRRLVVSALERRVSEGIAGDFKSSVTFEKVGWGRWNARLNGHSRSENNTKIFSNLPSSCEIDLQNSQKVEWIQETMLHDDSTSYSHDGDIDIDIDTGLGGVERDMISIDSRETYSSQASIDEDELMSDNSSDTTDDEDWASLGAAALRAASYSTFRNATKYLSSQTFEDGYQDPNRLCFPTLTKSIPQRHSISDTNFTIYNMTPNSQEREAVEALLNLGSI